MSATDAEQNDVSLPMEQRKIARKKHLDLLLNPYTNFDPATFQPGLDESEEDYELRKRERTIPPSRLPTLGMKPLQILEGQMIGMYESKQELYLLIAWLSHRITDLEEELNRLKQQ